MHQTPLALLVRLGDFVSWWQKIVIELNYYYYHLSNILIYILPLLAADQRSQLNMYKEYS